MAACGLRPKYFCEMTAWTCDKNELRHSMISGVGIASSSVSRIHWRILSVFRPKRVITASNHLPGTQETNRFPFGGICLQRL